MVVHFEVKPSNWDQFLPAMKENARLSLQRESGCRQFDVCTSAAAPYKVFLYEVYDSEDAFQAHLTSDHFLQFNAQTSGWLESKQVDTWTRVFSSVEG